MFFRIKHSQMLLFMMNQMYLVVRTKDVELISISSLVIRHKTKNEVFQVWLSDTAQKNQVFH